MTQKSKLHHPKLIMDAWFAVTQSGLAGKTSSGISGSDSPGRPQTFQVLWASLNAVKTDSLNRVTRVR